MRRRSSGRAVRLSWFPVDSICESVRTLLEGVAG